MASSRPGSIAANASFVGANTTYGPLLSTETMLTAGLACPEISELNVEMSGMLASTVPIGWLSKFFQLGSSVLNASQPDPCGSGIGVTVVGVGVGSSALAVIASGSDATIAAMPAAAPKVLLVRVFNSGSSARQVPQPASHIKASDHRTPKSALPETHTADALTCTFRTFAQRITATKQRPAAR